MFPFLLGLVGYIAAYLFWTWVAMSKPDLVQTLNAWALPSITVLLLIGLWMVLT